MFANCNSPGLTCDDYPTPEVAGRNHNEYSRHHTSSVSTQPPKSHTW